MWWNQRWWIGTTWHVTEIEEMSCQWILLPLIVLFWKIIFMIYLYVVRDLSILSTLSSVVLYQFVRSVITSVIHLPFVFYSEQFSLPPIHVIPSNLTLIVLQQLVRQLSATPTTTTNVFNPYMNPPLSVKHPLESLHPFSRFHASMEVRTKCGSEWCQSRMAALISRTFGLIFARWKEVEACCIFSFMSMLQTLTGLNNWITDCGTTVTKVKCLQIKSCSRLLSALSFFISKLWLCRSNWIF